MAKIVVTGDDDDLYIITITPDAFRVKHIDENGSGSIAGHTHGKTLYNCSLLLLHNLDIHSACNQEAEVGPAHTEPLPGEPPGDIKP